MTPRMLCPSEHVQDLKPTQILCKYMPYSPGFRSLIELRCLYLSSLEFFKTKGDPLEGLTSFIEQDVTDNSEVQKWYETNKAHTFITCFVAGSAESEYMWNKYAGTLNGPGLMFKTTVGRLSDELRSPPCQDRSPILSNEASPCDGFTVGVVEYFNDSRMKLHEEMSQPISNIRHVFRKREDEFAKENEYRVMMKPGSTTSKSSQVEQLTYCFVEVDLPNLISEIRLMPGASQAFHDEIRTFLDNKGLAITPLLRSDLDPTP